MEEDKKEDSLGDKVGNAAALIEAGKQVAESSVNPVQLGVMLFSHRKKIIKILMILLFPVFLGILILVSLPSLIFNGWNDASIIENEYTFQETFDEVKDCIRESILSNLTYQKNDLEGDYQDIVHSYKENGKTVIDTNSEEEFDDNTVEDGDYIVRIGKNLSTEGSIQMDAALIMSYYTVYKEEAGGARWINAVLRKIGWVSKRDFEKKLKSCKDIMFEWSSKTVSNVETITKSETYSTGEVDEQGNPVMETRTLTYTLENVTVNYEISFEGDETIAKKLKLSQKQIALAKTYAESVPYVVDSTTLDITVDDIDDNYDLPLYDGDISELRKSLVAFAKEQLGKPYIYATNGPNSFDCSGFVYYVLHYFHVPIERTSAAVMKQKGMEKEKQTLEPGDLVFYSSSSGGINHVMLYIGNNKVIGASGGPKMVNGVYVQNGSVKIKNYDYRTPTAYASFIKEKNVNYGKGKSLGKFDTFGYCSCDICTEKWGISATGEAIENKTIALSTTRAETRLIIGNKLYEVGAVGEQIKEKQIGIYFSSHDKAMGYEEKKKAVFAAKEKETSSGINETTGNRTYTLSDDDYTFVCKVVAAESDVNYEGSLAVISNILNRVESSKYPNTILGVIKATWQYTGYYNPGTHVYPYKKKVPSAHVKQAVTDALNGKRNIPKNVFYFLTHGCKEPAYSKGFYQTIGGNDYYY